MIFKDYFESKRIKEWKYAYIDYASLLQVDRNVFAIANTYPRRTNSIPSSRGKSPKLTASTLFS